MAIRDQQISELRKRLEDERARLVSELRDLQSDASQWGESVRDEDSSYGNHMADEGTDTFEQEKEIALQRNLRSVLNEIEAALKRMDEGTYGICIDCGQEIPIERLMARPYAVRCVADQEKYDRVHR
ncbi:transcriptional regulator, TraR/DksA family [Thermobaculum terrenum ATCC BAA-798]|uniref:Transcriptional regulator, TraR/DksA family n=1 Tax=Thermobaculum terrenum (strain ATCC BAA-798 / CCMEE 7001 / YNP1) TaxID=525904 RepID=D1CBT8_THET1|nr:TraR/DksA C4-type zinc finger protein [Thermobaculum terrenum]ACZ42253.1 transcriptional regulator, TraR/DksA family [Thermobaculum terrenum ATCC BAA-798]